MSNNKSSCLLFPEVAKSAILTSTRSIYFPSEAKEAAWPRHSWNPCRKLVCWTVICLLLSLSQKGRDKMSEWSIHHHHETEMSERIVFTDFCCKICNVGVTFPLHVCMCVCVSEGSPRDPWTPSVSFHQLARPRCSMLCHWTPWIHPTGQVPEPSWCRAHCGPLQVRAQIHTLTAQRLFPDAVGPLLQRQHRHSCIAPAGKST